VKALLLIILSVWLLGEAFGMARRSPAPAKEVPNVELTPIEVLPTPTNKITVAPFTLEVKGIEQNKFAEKIEAVFPIVVEIAQSPEFEARILKSWWNGKPGFQDSKDSPEQVLVTLKSRTWKPEFAFKYQRSLRGCPVTAWTYANTNTIFFNTCNVLTRDTCGIVGTIFHETAHKFGYGHSSAKRTLSVPYVLGTQAALLCKSILSRKAM